MTSTPSSEHRDAAPGAFLETLLRSYAQAKAKNGPYLDKTYVLGAFTIRVCILGEKMRSVITPALDHLEGAPSKTPSLTIYIWDDASTGTQMPPPPWEWHLARGRRGEIDGYNTERFYTSYEEGSDLLNVLDTASRTAIHWTRDANHLPGNEYGAPLRCILHWLAKSTDNPPGLQFVHGGAVGTPEGGVLLAGKGGSGKSTSVLACLPSPLRYAADDYCLITSEPEPYVYSIYNSAKVNSASLARLPYLAPGVSNPDQVGREKAILFLDQHWKSKLIPGFPVVAIILPTVRGGTLSRLVPTSRENATRGICLSTLIQLPRADTVSIARIQKLVDALPCYSLELGTDMQQIPQLLGELISERVVARAASTLP